MMSGSRDDEGMVYVTAEQMAAENGVLFHDSSLSLQKKISCDTARNNHMNIRDDDKISLLSDDIVPQ